ncbi:YciI family protein [uncultured Cellulomonas sp.]|uniref:YciI family protein n=1 Tax=uncultured Cellulomonas sp. TaxID=189682 RepID=UPI0026038944|nr:YciI family protein [uncultured Cellulomonas sp.]
MTIYAVQYTYDDRTERRDEVRSEHRGYLAQLVESGSLLSSGPWADGAPGALLLMSADSAADVERLLDADPFTREGLVAGREVRAWTPVLGTWGA